MMIASGVKSRRVRASAAASQRHTVGTYSERGIAVNKYQMPGTMGRRF